MLLNCMKTLNNFIMIAKYKILCMNYKFLCVTYQILMNQAFLINLVFNSLVRNFKKKIKLYNHSLLKDLILEHF